MHCEGLDSQNLFKIWYNHHKLQIPWSSLSLVTTTMSLAIINLIYSSENDSINFFVLVSVNALYG